MRILIVASNISARMGGEAVLPYHYIRELSAKGIEIHAITHARVREEVTSGPLADCATFHFVEDSFLEKFFFRLGEIAPAALRDAVFNSLVAFVTLARLGRKTKILAREHEVDLVHQPTPVSPLFPSFTYSLGVPVIIGPMNGAMSFPPGFRQAYSKGGDALVNFGRVFGDLVNRFIPGKRKAQKVLVSNQRTQDGLPQGIPAERIATLAENGVDLSLWTPQERVRPADPLYIFVGRLILLKGVDLMIEAFARADENAQLLIIGDGPEKANLEALASQRAPGRVQFSGFLPQTEIRDRLSKATALVFPSLRDCGGAVILEAFACGVPAIASDWGGPQDYITPETGVLVEPREREQFIDGLARAMIKLGDDPEVALSMGEAARAYVEANFSWAAKADKMIAIYKDVIAAAES